MAEEKFEIDWGNEKLKRAQKQTEENPYDLEAWSLLIREAQGRWIGEMRLLFERLIQVFPSAGRYWKIYIELEMRARNFERVEKNLQSEDTYTPWAGPDMIG
ncbi:hypothetical protein J437_LFUL014735 [Ladona fulva]|uniref:Suppressor of forked domain-containing protein n=1 Tax=Ladona fulva TaxID=123851 RepID=A0A8K0P7U2_LADFU|nr:hypothetical protein J437_LFUL014735 [Ladona fulva]